jgi:hypothetical protein
VQAPPGNNAAQAALRQAPAVEAACVPDVASCLGSITAGVTREQRGLADVVQTEVQHDHTLQTDTGATVGVGAVFERLQIVFDVGLGDVALRGAFLEQFDVVNALSARRDLLTAQEHVVRIGVVLTTTPHNAASEKSGTSTRQNSNAHTQNRVTEREHGGRGRMGVGPGRTGSLQSIMV